MTDPTLSFLIYRLERVRVNYEQTPRRRFVRRWILRNRCDFVAAMVLECHRQQRGLL